MPPHAARTLVLKRADQIAAVTHPLRFEIIERLQLDGPDSIAGLARKLDRRANALTYHVRLLERIGVMLPSGTRRAGNRLERVYALAAPHLALGASPGPHPSRRAIARSATAVLRMAERELRRAIEVGALHAGRPKARPLGRRFKTWLTEANLASVHARLDELQRFVDRCHRKKLGRPHALTLVVVPLGLERDR